MSEATLGLNILEQIKNPEKYRFLATLAEDYPEIAKKVAERIPMWSQRVDAAFKLEGYADQILQKMEYRTRKDELAFCQEVATQIITDLEANPNKKICFIQWGTRGSEPYFHKLILEKISPDLRKRIVIPSGNEKFRMLKNDPNIHVYYIDDSANSGKQMYQSIVSTFKHTVDGNRTADIPFTAFLMGMTDEAKDTIAPFLKNNLKAQETHEDNGTSHRLVWQVPENQTRAEFNFSPTPTMYDAVDSLIEQGKIKKEDEGKFLIDAHHNFNVGTLLLFYHRLLQDNVAAIFKTGRLSDSLKEEHGIEPLFEGFEEVNAYDSHL